MILKENKNSKTSHTHNRSFFKQRQASQNNSKYKNKRIASLAKPISVNNYNSSDIYNDQNYINIRTDFVDYKSKDFL